MGVDVSSADLQGYWSFNEGLGRVTDSAVGGEPGYLGPDTAGFSKVWGEERSLSTPVRHSWELIREQSPVS